MAYGFDDRPMLCPTCGSEIEPGARFCSNCGAAVRPPATGFDDRPTLCPTCGSEMEPGARFCPNCGATAQPPATGHYANAPGSSSADGPEYGWPDNVPNYLVWAILATICCCLPTGIVAIVFAAQVNGKLTAGDYAGALSASSSAKTWCWVSFGLGILAWIVGIVSAFR